jgi:hypothetical protein
MIGGLKPTKNHCHTLDKMIPFVDSGKVPSSIHANFRGIALRNFPLRLESEEARFSLLRKRPVTQTAQSGAVFLGRRCREILLPLSF